MRFKDEDPSSMKQVNTCLEDDTIDGYDQFKDKKTSYDFNKYTSNLDESKITKEQRLVAERIERELG